MFMATVAQAKPLPSLSVKMKWQGELIYETPMKLVLSVYSHVASDNLEIVLNLPEGVTLLEGNARQLTSVEQSTPVEQSYLILISQKAVGQIKAEARIKHSGETTFYAVAGLPVKISAKEKLSPRAAKKETFKRIQRDGQWLREYQLP